MSTSRIIKLLDRLSYIFILASVVLVPLVIDSKLANYYVLPKQYIFIGLLLFNILFFAAKVALSRKFDYRQSVLDVILLVFLAVALLTSLFSGSLYASFLGRTELFLLNFVFLVFAVLFYFVFVNIVDSWGKWALVIDVLLAVGALSSLLFIVKTVFAYSLPLVGSVWNVVDGSHTAFGIWLIAILVLAAGQLMKKDLPVSRALYYFFIMFLLFIPLLVVGFKTLWWILLVGWLLVLLVGASFIRQVRLGWLTVLFGLLVISIFFIIFGSPKSLQVELPTEMSLNAKSSWVITSKTVFAGAKNFLLGSGLGSFATDFSRYRSMDFNYDQTAWSLRFSSPFGTYFAILAEGGVVLSLLFLLILLITLGYIFSSWVHKRTAREQTSPYSLGLDDKHSYEGVNLDLYLLLVSWLVLGVAMAFNFFGPSLWFLWWLLLALIISGLGLGGSQAVKKRSWTLADTPQYNLAFSFSLIVVMAMVVMFGVLGARFYWADKVYAQAIKATDYKTAEAKLDKVLSLRKNYDAYHVAKARSYLNRAGEIAAADKDKKQTQEVASLVAAAVNQARTATQLSPNTVGTWENLAIMYENASALVPESRSWAIKSLETAIKLEPTNAFLYWRLANNYYLAGNNDKAVSSYQKSIELKQDYAGAYVGLSQVYEQGGKMDKAIEAYQTLLSLGNRNADVLYNYGRLLYNRNKDTDRQAAEQVWLAVVKGQPKYSNALYSLGLLYESQGNKTKALQYYYQVKDLNPDNKDVVQKIEYLVGSSVSAQ